MKNLFFSLLAISLLSTTTFAGGAKKTVSKERHKTTCPADCSRKDCPKTATCPIPGCVCK